MPQIRLKNSTVHVAIVDVANRRGVVALAGALIRMHGGYVQVGNGSSANDYGVFAQGGATVEIYGSHVAAHKYLATDNLGAEVLMLSGLVEGTTSEFATKCVSVGRTDSNSAGWTTVQSDCLP